MITPLSILFYLLICAGLGSFCSWADRKRAIDLREQFLRADMEAMQHACRRVARERQRHRRTEAGSIDLTTLVCTGLLTAALIGLMTLEHWAPALRGLDGQDLLVGAGFFACGLASAWLAFCAGIREGRAREREERHTRRYRLPSEL